VLSPEAFADRIRGRAKDEDIKRKEGKKKAKKGSPKRK